MEYFIILEETTTRYARTIIEADSQDQAEKQAITKYRMREVEMLAAEEKQIRCVECSALPSVVRVPVADK
jgi:hypothetical protein